MSTVDFVLLVDLYECIFHYYTSLFCFFDILNVVAMNIKFSILINNSSTMSIMKLNVFSVANWWNWISFHMYNTIHCAFAYAIVISCGSHLTTWLSRERRGGRLNACIGDDLNINAPKSDPLLILVPRG